MQRLTRLTWPQLIALSAPAFVTAGFLVPLAVFIPPFLTEHVGLPLTAVGTILLIGRLWDVINDPIMGALTDATSTPIGRRRPWILAGVPLAMLGTWQIYFAEPGTSFAAVTIWMVVLFAGWTMVIVAHGAWGAEISSEYHERSRIFGAKTIAVAVSLPFFVLGPAILERTSGADVGQQMALMGITVLIGLPVAVGFLFWITPEPRSNPTRLTWGSIAGSYLVIFRQKTFALISLAYFFVGASEAIGTSTYFFLVRDALTLPNWIASFLVVQALTCLFSLPIWLTVSRRTDKRIALIGVFTVMSILAPIPLFLPQGDVGAFALYACAKGLTWGAEYTLLRSIVSDLIDDDAGEDGTHRAGIFYASFSLTFGIAQALGAAGILWLLAAYGFSPSAPPEDRATFGGLLRWIAVCAPLIAALACMVLISRFKVNQRSVDPAIVT
jgi:GPH family glycoside/pentoside/hexuronide:cation symporter